MAMDVFEVRNKSTLGVYVMKKHHLLLTFLMLMGLIYTPAAGVVDISGEWIFSVDLESGGHGDPTFVFKQQGEKLTGNYSGPLGDLPVTGTVKGDTAVFGFEVSREGETIKATYTAKITGPARMNGTVEFGSQTRGKWTAIKKDH